jgi:hypothetical protein
MRSTLAMLAAATCLTCAACGGQKSCAKPTQATGPCADLTFENRSYDEWRVVHPHGILQEVGDAFYPACNKAKECGGDPLQGKQATDLWRYDGVDSTRAVIGLRQDTHTYVVFVRVGLDPATLSPSPGQ